MAVVAGRGVPHGRADGDVTSGRNNLDVSQREDLANFISMITRDETPFMSSIGKTKATAIFHEWQTDSLEPPGNSKIEEGTDYIIPGQSGGAFNNPTQTNTNIGSQFAEVGPMRTRLGNYTQINGKTIAVSGTRRAIDQAGVADEYAYQLKKRGTELRRDLEHDLIHKYQVTIASGQRRMSGVQAWLTDSIDNSIHYSGGAGIGTVLDNGAQLVNNAGNSATAAADNVASGRTVYAPDNANKVPLSLSQIDQVMQAIYQEGGKATKIMVSPKLRRDFSDLMVTDSGVRRNIDMDGKLRQSVDIYMSDFGDLMVVPNYIMGLAYDVDNSFSGTLANSSAAADSCALIYDPMWFSLATLRPLQEVDVGQRGDSTVGMMVEEMTLEVKNPIGCGAIYNLT